MDEKLINVFQLIMPVNVYQDIMKKNEIWLEVAELVGASGERMDLVQYKWHYGLLLGT